MPPRKSGTSKRKAASPPHAASAKAKKPKVTSAGSTPTASQAVKATGKRLNSKEPQVVAAPPQPNSNLDNTLTAFEGKFDLYSTALPFIHKFYRPPGTSTPDYKATHAEILEWQAKPDYTSRIVLNGKSAGRLYSRTICNPFDDPLTPIVIENGKVRSSLDLDAGQEGEPLLFQQSGEGYVASFSFEDQTCFGMTGCGRFTLRHVWQGDSEDEALFEGSMVLKMKYGSLMRGRGYGSGFTYRDQFRAVRALKDDDGEEIGIDVAGDDPYADGDELYGDY